MITPGLEPVVQSSHGAADQSSQNSMAVILRGLNDTLAQLTKASERHTATLASLKEDILLCPDSDEEADEDNSNTSNKQLNVSAMLNNVLDPRTLAWRGNLLALTLRSRMMSSKA